MTENVIYSDPEFIHFVCGLSTTEYAMGNVVLKLAYVQKYANLDTNDIKFFGPKAKVWLEKARCVTDENRFALIELAKLILDVREGHVERPKR